MEWTEGWARAVTIGPSVSGRAVPSRAMQRLGRVGGGPWAGRARRFAWLSLAGLALLGPAGCGSGAERAGASSPEPLDPWQGPIAALFDDSIHAAAVGLSLEGARAQDDPMIRSRCATADLVARVRVNTVTRDSVGAKITYHLMLQVGEPTLLPAKLRDRSLELVIHQGSQAFGIVSSLESSLRNKTFIVFARRFVGERGPELHWVLTADTPEVAAVIGTASLGETAAQ
jgi:hypothetical protein